MNRLYKIISFLLIVTSSINVIAQDNGYPTVNAGEDVFLDCSTGNCTDLSVSFLETGDSNSYEMSSIGFNPPFAFDYGNNVESVDDVFSDIMRLRNFQILTR